MISTKIIQLILGLFLILPFSIFAQNEATVKGKVLESTSKNPLEYATIIIYSQKDSSIISGETTNAQGIYNITIPYGDYFGKIEFIAYHPQVITPFTLTSESNILDIGITELIVNSTSLIEVEVMTSKGDMQMTLDKKIYNVGKDISSTGGTATDVLGNVPSVEVSQEGAISLRGNSGVQILIDGKPSAMAGKNGTGLKQLSANQIERIEVITNPSAKYEAEGTAGIINIVLKKEKKPGVNGSIIMTVGYRDIYGISANLNYRKNRFNFFTNIGLDYRKNHGYGALYQEIQNDSLAIMEFERDHVLGGLWGNARLGADYYFNDNNILTTAVTYRQGQDNDEINMVYRDYVNDLFNPIGISTRDDNTIKDESNLEYSLTYTRKFGEKGHELVGDIRFQDVEKLDGSELIGKYFDSDFNPNGIQDLAQRSSDEEGERRLITKIDYTYPISKTEKIELGYQGSFRNIKNNFLVEEQTNNDWKVLTNVSNDFKYDENIYGIYGTYKNRKGNLAYQFGARMEYTDVLTVLVNTNVENPRQYLNFFPSASFKYDLKNSNALKISYSRRIRRPTYNDLSPFFTYNDPRNQFSGNPDLKPEYTDSYELSHVKYWEKGSMSSAVFYRHRTNVINRILEQINGDTTLLRSENLKSREDIGLDFTVTYKPTVWWNLSANTVFFYVANDASNLDETYQNDNYSWTARVNSRFKIKNKTDLQLTFNYRAPQAKAQGINKSIAFLNLGVSRVVLNNRGKLTFNIADVFNSAVFRGMVETENIYRETEFLWTYRTFRLSLNYRLSQ
ncbi:MAG: TonB-dependent receptor [Saprospiraceae bacterium]